MNFDTHESIKDLVRQGFKEKQAKSIVKIVFQSREHDISNLATKDHVKTLADKGDSCR